MATGGEARTQTHCERVVPRRTPVTERSRSTNPCRRSHVPVQCRVGQHCMSDKNYNVIYVNDATFIAYMYLYSCVSHILFFIVFIYKQ